MIYLKLRLTKYNIEHHMPITHRWLTDSWKRILNQSPMAERDKTSRKVKLEKEYLIEGIK
jgi:hypothetical protein